MITSTQEWSSTIPWSTTTDNVVYHTFPVAASTFTISATRNYPYEDDLRRLTRAKHRAAQALEHWRFIRTRCCTYEEIYEPAEVLIPRHIVVPRYYPREGLGLLNWSHRYRSK